MSNNVPKHLSSALVYLGKTKKGTSQRPGFVDEDGQVYLPPASAKRLDSWKKKMEARKKSFA